MKIEVYERYAARRRALSVIGEVLGIVALAMVIVLAGLMICAELAARAEDATPAEDTEIVSVAETALPVPEIETPEPVPEAPASDPVGRISAEGRDLLERVVMAEAGNQPYEGLMAAAEVVLNRSELWGMTITEVINAPGQFCEPYKGEVSGDVKRAVTDALAGIKVFRDPVTHFHNAGVTPAWASAKTLAGQIGDHKFYH
jgi:N-acetylmuramoyl-L-alanine amidase